MGESGILLLIFLLLLGAILAVSIVLIRKAERERDEALQHVARMQGRIFSPASAMTSRRR